MGLLGNSPFGRIDVGGGKTIAQVKNFFFDRDKVLRAADKATIQVLGRFGAFVRRRAQTSMRRKKGASPPGQPPHAHGEKRAGKKYSGAWLRELVLFAYDPLTRSVVVGPLGFRRSSVPALHEFGGTQDRMGWRTEAGKRVVKKVGTARYPPRPYMRPALLAELPKFAELFRGSIGR